jgi:hypothetical protein
MKSCSGSNISLDWLTWVFSTLEIIWPSTHQCNHPLDPSTSTTLSLGNYLCNWVLGS